MPAFLSARQAAQLQKIARPYKKQVKLGKPWEERTDDELWRKVLSQIVVVGRAEPGIRLEHDPNVKRQVSIKRLKRFQNDGELQKYLHGVFVELGVRFVKRNWKTDAKTIAAVKNFRKLTDRTKPIQFFEQIAKLKTEEEKIAALQKGLRYFGNKGARDSLIDLRLAENCMALDARIFGVLKKVGVRVSPDDIFRQIEKELIAKVAEPLGISGGRLDRILFQNYSRILKRI